MKRLPSIDFSGVAEAVLEFKRKVEKFSRLWPVHLHMYREANRW